MFRSFCISLVPGGVTVVEVYGVADVHVPMTRWDSDLRGGAEAARQDSRQPQNLNQRTIDEVIFENLQSENTYECKSDMRTSYICIIESRQV